MGTKSTNSNVVWQSQKLHKEAMKRSVQVNVKMSPEDFGLLKKAAAKKWPDAVITNSGILLALARISAREILRKGEKGREP
jgi:hypothetical protein